MWLKASGATTKCMLPCCRQENFFYLISPVSLEKEKRSSRFFSVDFTDSQLKSGHDKTFKAFWLIGSQVKELRENFSNAKKKKKKKT